MAHSKWVHSLELAPVCLTPMLQVAWHAFKAKPRLQLAQHGLVHPQVGGGQLRGGQGGAVPAAATDLGLVGAADLAHTCSSHAAMK